MSGIYDMDFGALHMYYAHGPTYKKRSETKSIVLRCDVEKDKDILDAIKDVKNKNDYIKSLLRQALDAKNK